MRKCINCKYWKMVLEADEDNDDDGECRRFPPVLVRHVEDPRENKFLFPDTEGKWWCGEFQNKE